MDRVLPLRFRTILLLFIGVLPQYFNTTLFNCRSTAKNFLSVFLTVSIRYRVGEWKEEMGLKS